MKIPESKGNSFCKWIGEFKSNFISVKNRFIGRIAAFGLSFFETLNLLGKDIAQLLGKILNTLSCRTTELGRDYEDVDYYPDQHPGARILPAIVAAIFSLLHPTLDCSDKEINKETKAPWSEKDKKNITQEKITIRLTDSLHTKAFAKVETINTTFQNSGIFKKHVLARLLYVSYIAAAIICRVGEFVCGALGIAASTALLLLNGLIWNSSLCTFTDRVIRFSCSNLTLLALPGDIIYALGRVLNPAEYTPPKKEI